MEQMLKSKKKKFGFSEWEREILFRNTSDPVDPTIVKNALQCSIYYTCFIRATVYHNISTILKYLEMEIYSAEENWTDKNNRTLLGEIEGRVVRTLDYVIIVKKGVPLFEFIDDVLQHIAEGGIFMHIIEMFFEKLKIESKLHVATFADTYYAINIRHLQTAFYLLMLGCVLAVASFFIEIMWHRYWSKGRGPTGTSVCHVKT
jgi:hypothetical protein